MNASLAREMTMADACCSGDRRRNLGMAIIERLLADGWDVAGGAVSAETLERIRGAGAHAVEIDVTDQGPSLPPSRRSGLASGGSTWSSTPPRPTPAAAGARFGGGNLADSDPDSFERWATSPARGAYGALSASARFLTAQGGPATVVQITGGSSRRAMPGRGLWAAGAFGRSRLTQAAALELREQEIHVALCSSTLGIDRSGQGDAAPPTSRASPTRSPTWPGQSPRAMTHELQVTPALDNWTP